MLAAAGLESSYARYRPVPYRRGSHPFVANLSAVDLLFHAGDEAGGVLRDSIAGPPSTRAEIANGLRRSDD
jgi:hypothetical protein